jgi:Flp pilus assembly protein TadG
LGKSGDSYGALLMTFKKTTISLRLSSLARDDSGLAIIEFAYSLPVLMILFMAGLEVANLAIAHMRVSQMAMLVADNASRVRKSIDEANINQIFIGAETASGSLKFKANGRIFLSDLEPNGLASPNTGQYIRWQRCWGDGNFTSSYGVANDGKTNSSMSTGMGPGTTAATKISAADGTAVMFVEVAYNYQPLISNAIFGNKVIRYTSAFNVRERTDQAITNAGSPTATVASC